VLAGAFMMIKKEVLEKVKGFDESFFMYGEDIDLSYRIQQAGYSIFYLGETTIIHFKGESAKKQNLNYVRLFYSAMNIFVSKHYNKTIAFVFSLFIHLAIAVRTFVTVLFRLVSFSNKNTFQPSSKTLIVGSAEEQQEINLLLEKARYKINSVSGFDTKNISSIINYSKHSEIKKIIFCEGSIRYSEIISCIQSTPNKSFRFHATGSKSIVGSDSKKGSGEVVAL
jgi:hypothetical protein